VLLEIVGTVELLLVLLHEGVLLRNASEPGIGKGGLLGDEVVVVLKRGQTRE